MLSRGLLESHQVEVIDLSKRGGGIAGEAANRVVEVIGILKDVWRVRRKPDLIYLTISESVGGNLKDLLIYALCWRGLSRMFIHLHGGSLKRVLFDRHAVLARLNKPFLARLGGVIVSGESHLPIFEKLINRDRIHVVPNFAGDELFIKEADIIKKFSRTQPVRVLFISSLQEKKGYKELVEAYRQLPDQTKAKIQIDFAGRFPNESEKQAFLDKIAEIKQITYHGVIDEERKRALFSAAHIFCLPTTFLEGQPISILEAYASGCVVLSTCPPGILDIFAVGINGMDLGDGSPESIRFALEQMLEARERLLPMALVNRETAGKLYRTSVFIERLKKIMESAVDPQPIRSEL